jgi:SlyX protein
VQLHTGDPMQRTIEDLEVKIAFLEHTVAELDGVVRETRDELDRLRRDIVTLQEQTTAMMPATEDTKPPHY